MDACVEQNVRDAMSADFNLTALSYPLSNPSEMSKMRSTSTVLDLSDGFGTIISHAVVPVCSLRYISVMKGTYVR